ncbi:hypothetical protein [Rummeliibacillus stabekisii]|uniref:hypothetical protein n=1 Tax=Rummeliibacillus stabekisii TaxID=241244 RepID=UPI00117282B3|nr:hypothetical protein [Rummeliibacillus stabekisii]MBB5170564.1 hypothetical protein [Rummeliibacillus stabekisii]GEL04818.1 hypothetical protein RST01_14450 [Rummeliibacillus stabekisii]
MNIYMLIISSIFLLFIAGNAFYVTFKRFKEDDDFILNTLDWIDSLFSVLLIISEKLTTTKYHIVIFKMLSFIFGLIFLGFTVLLWFLFI